MTLQVRRRRGWNLRLLRIGFRAAGARWAALCGVLLLAISPAQAVPVGGALPVGRPLLVKDVQAELVAKAEADECFNGVGKPYPPGPPCAVGQEKVNQTYAWGAAKAGSLVWIGTGANVHCLVNGAYFGATGTLLIQDETVCEGRRSQRAKSSRLITGPIGDSRPPRAYTYDTLTGELIDRSPQGDQLFEFTLGLRSAGAHGGVVLLAGPAIHVDFGINIFAYRADTGAYLGSTRLSAYNNIRSWQVVNGVLYTGVLNKGGGGTILRWRGSITSPFQFEVVGSIDNEVAYLAEHAGRLFVTTWSGVTQRQGKCPNDNCPLAGLWMSPALPASGLAAAQAGLWQKVWDAGDYEPDPITARAYLGGALHSFDGWLYWGTLHVPGLAYLSHLDEYGRRYPGRAMARTKTERATSIFRGRNFTTAPELELLYGETSLPVYTGGSSFQNQATGMGPPEYGPSGFGNEFNTYTWTMGIYGGKLYVGTFKTFLVSPGEGGDLWRFPSASQAAEAVSRDGVGNRVNWGIRTMIADDALYLGTAGRANLRTDPPDGPPIGGWELIVIR